MALGPVIRDHGAILCGVHDTVFFLLAEGSSSPRSELPSARAAAVLPIYPSRRPSGPPQDERNG